MFHNSYRKKQSGFLLPVALFIIVVLGGMAIVVSKKVSQTSFSYIIDGVSVQTFFAAESGAQAGLHTLFFLDDDRQLVDARCEVMNLSKTLNVEGLKNCAVTVVCDCRYEDNSVCDADNSANYLALSGVDHSFYTLESSAQCGVSPVISQHTIEVGASL